ncbi:hypothetical protein SB719_21520, partial [Pantoea sp. SIMBA_079]|uniref:hypothetical protein n=1 Tax=Pantoea sp. SIMBA_079 TaxID=3085817 RepID=UPI003991B1F7
LNASSSSQDFPGWKMTTLNNVHVSKGGNPVLPQPIHGTDVAIDGISHWDNIGNFEVKFYLLKY